MPNQRRAKVAADGTCERCGEIHRKCAGHSKRSGRPCGVSPLKGSDMCRTHAGNAVARDAAAERHQEAEGQRQAARALVLLGELPAVDPIRALLGLIASKSAELDYYRSQVATLEQPELPDPEGYDGDDPDHDERSAAGDVPSPIAQHPLIWGVTAYTDKTGGEDWGKTTKYEAGEHMWLRLMHKAEDQLADFCAKALKAGVAERQVRVAEQQGIQLAQVIRRIAVDVLTALQRAGLDSQLTRVYQQTLEASAHQHLMAMETEQVIPGQLAGR